MLKKLATHNVKDVSELFSLVDKCARAVEEHAWHSHPALEAGKASKPEAGSAAQGSGKNKKKMKKKSNNNNKPLAGAPTTAAITVETGGGHNPHSDKLPHQPSDSDEGGPLYLMHNSRRHSTVECREIKKLMEHFREKQKQQPHRDIMPPL
jgi:hypothetical protein